MRRRTRIAAAALVALAALAASAPTASAHLHGRVNFDTSTTGGSCAVGSKVHRFRHAYEDKGDSFSLNYGETRPPLPCTGTLRDGLSPIGIGEWRVVLQGEFLGDAPLSCDAVPNQAPYFTGAATLWFFHPDGSPVMRPSQPTHQAHLKLDLRAVGPRIALLGGSSGLYPAGTQALGDVRWPCDGAAAPHLELEFKTGPSARANGDADSVLASR